MNNHAETIMPSLFSIGLDICKNVFHLVGFRCQRKDCFPQEDRAFGTDRYLQEAPSCIVGMEACMSAYFGSLRAEIFADPVDVCEGPDSDADQYALI